MPHSPRSASRRLSLLTLLCLLTMVFAGACNKSDDESWVPIDVDKPSRKTSKKAKKTAKKRKSTKSKAGKKAKSKPKPTASDYPAPAAEAQRIERSDTSHLQARARKIHQRLVDALPTKTRANLEKVPFVFDKRKGHVNAFAACIRKLGPVLSVSNGLMQVQAQLSRARAVDEVFGTSKFNEYIQLVAKRRILTPARDFISASQDQDAHKRSRQAQLLDEGLAFVIGHELAHHHLSHTGCIGADAQQLTTADLGRLFARKLPGFNQPNELAADVYGIQNVLTASTKTASWSEQGALLMLRFFAARTNMSLSQSVVFGFERTHPHPDVRTPVIKETASTYRLTGGAQLPSLPNIGLGR